MERCLHVAFQVSGLYLFSSQRISDFGCWRSIIPGHLQKWASSLLCDYKSLNNILGIQLIFIRKDFSELLLFIFPVAEYKVEETVRKNLFYLSEGNITYMMLCNISACISAAWSFTSPLCQPGQKTNQNPLFFALHSWLF